MADAEYSFSGARPEGCGAQSARISNATIKEREDEDGRGLSTE